MNDETGGKQAPQTPNIPEVFLKPYDAKANEESLYKLWEESGFFNPDVCIEKGITQADAEPFSMVLPPPNVTGVLHMGSALMLAIEDILVRRARMQGKRTLWIPGTDSAAIATQARVEKDVQKAEGKSRHDLGREELLKRIDVFVEESKSTILSQMRAIGASLDWSRYAYTMDDARYNAVMKAFVRMYNAELIFRGDRIVNWDPKGQTTISDDEIVYEEEQTTFYYFKYGPFTIGTARPETKFGDKYVVMHPDDARYSEYTHGQQIDLEWINGPITATVIKDTSIDMEFGTGVMTITPWHSVVDFEIAARHGLDKEQIIDSYGKLLPIAGEFTGMKIKDARSLIVEKLRAKGLVEKEEPYTHNVATAERTGGLIEPQIMKQWFVDVDKKFTLPYSEIPGIASGSETTLKELMKKAVTGGGMQFVTERYERVYMNWIDNLRPWCISRQIWFGHRIPVWYRGDETKVQIDSPGTDWTQDPDVLDTWFSSGLWTFSTLGWPEDTNDLKAYHPTTIIETGYDIIFFWVARMVLMSGFFLGQVPFKTVYLHGLVRDGQGRKISKSLGNNIDPVDMAEKYGMDAVRVSLIMGMAPGTDSKISEDKIRGNKHFANKLWNISRFVFTSIGDAEIDPATSLTSEDTALITELKELITTVDGHFENYRIDLASDAIYQYLWKRFADEIIEESKPILSSTNSDAIRSRQYVLITILTTSIKLLHPFMPFVTEAIWQHMPNHLKKDGSQILMVTKWPKA